ncbi:hypothetical protein C8Q75DRAFT_732851 [Abortiporus biennis]|nr:hypothetical protein C8Q75DRAFT_732851 [Abortiporus biennis]
MVDWNSPEEQLREADAFSKVVHVASGVYIWEFLISLDFDYMYLSRQKKFQWPMIFYFFVRYAMLSSMILKRLNCQALFTYLQIAGVGCGGLASINLALRCMAIWKRRLVVVIPLVVIILGHWSLILQGAQITAIYIDGVGCELTSNRVDLLGGSFVYAVCLDFVVMALTAYRLCYSTPWPSTGIMGILFQDGLIYFISSFFANLLAAIFNFMNLTPVLSIIFNAPAVVAAVIASTRAVRSLAAFTSEQGHIHYQSTNVHSAGLIFTEPADGARPPRDVTFPSAGRHQGVNVNIRMDTIVTVDDELSNSATNESMKKSAVDLSRSSPEEDIVNRRRRSSSSVAKNPL